MDYDAVFASFKRLLRGKAKVEEIVSVFKRAIWNTAEKAFPGVTVAGCSFHWCQAIFRGIKKNLKLDYCTGSQATKRFLGNYSR